jgi:hypothetical protein
MGTCGMGLYRQIDRKRSNDTTGCVSLRFLSDQAKNVELGRSETNVVLQANQDRTRRPTFFDNQRVVIFLDAAQRLTKVGASALRGDSKDF